MTVYELSRSQIVELKQALLEKRYADAGLSVSYGELANADRLVSDDAVIEAFAGTTFSEDDFFGNEDASDEERRRNTREWQVWFKRDDGSPRTKYLQLTENVRLLLSYVEYIDRFDATLCVKLGDLDFKTSDVLGEYCYNNDETWAFMENKALTWARGFLRDMRQQAGEALRQF